MRWSMTLRGVLPRRTEGRETASQSTDDDDDVLLVVMAAATAPRAIIAIQSNLADQESSVANGARTTAGRDACEDIQRARIGNDRRRLLPRTAKRRAAAELMVVDDTIDL